MPHTEHRSTAEGWTQALIAAAVGKAVMLAVRKTSTMQVKFLMVRFIDSNYNITSCKNQKFAVFSALLM
jgi:lipocalin